MNTNPLQIIGTANREQQVDAFFVRFATDIAAENFDAVMRATVALYKEQTQDDDYEAIKQANRLFEAVAEQNTAVSLCLMAELYDPASEVFAHDITDSIELWIDEQGSVDLLRYIQRQQAVPEKLPMQNVYKDWVASLQKKFGVA